MKQAGQLLKSDPDQRRKKVEESYPTALELIKQNRLPLLLQLVTHHYKLQDSVEAFQTAADRNCQAIKLKDVVLTLNGDNSQLINE